VTIPWRLLAWLSLITAIAAGGWYVKGLLAANADLRQRVDQLETDYRSLNTLWQQERDALSSREAAYRRIAGRNHALSQKLSEVLTREAQNDPCIGTPVPAAVDQRLRELYQQAVPERARAGDGSDAAP